MFVTGNRPQHTWFSCAFIRTHILLIQYRAHQRVVLHDTVTYMHLNSDNTRVPGQLYQFSSKAVEKKHCIGFMEALSDQDHRYWNLQEEIDAFIKISLSSHLLSCQNLCSWLSIAISEYGHHHLWTVRSWWLFARRWTLTIIYSRTRI